MSTTGSQISLVSVGSRGDIQPYLVFGVYLKGLGYRVRVCSEERHKQLILQSGVEFGLIYGDCVGVLYQKDMQAALETGSLFKMIGATKAWEAKFSKEEMLRSYVTALSGSHLIICGGLSLTQAICVAEYMKVPVVPMILGPTIPTQDFPVWPLVSLVWSKCQNRWSYHFLFRTLWKQEKPHINHWRESELGLAPWTSLKNGIADLTANLNVIIACSRIILPNKQKPSDYPDNIHLKGFVFQGDNQGEQGEDSLVAAFISQAKSEQKKLVYLGFGSMPCTDPGRLVRIANELCTSLGCRAVLLANWPSLTASASASVAQQPQTLSVPSSDVLMIPSASHGWLFPQMDCVVHHCGVGTLASGLRAGVPCVPCPYGMDQPHNAKLLISLGVAPVSVPYNKNMTTSALAAAVGRVLTLPTFRQRASEWQKVLMEEESNCLQEYATVVASELARTGSAISELH